MRKLLAIFCFFGLVAVANAKSLVLTLSDGTQVYYLLGGEQNPVMRFDDGNITVDADKYAFTNVVKFHISQTDDPNGISEVETPENKYDGSTLYICTAKEKVSVYTVDGKKVKATVNVADGLTAVSLGGLEKGVYVVKIGKKETVKVIRK